MSWRVDDESRWRRLLIGAYGLGMGLPLLGAIALSHRACRVVWKGDRSALSRQHIFCMWHEDLLAAFVALRHFPNHAWMNHASWYMKPIHVAARAAGVGRLHLGSTGDGGRVAADALSASLVAGMSTLILPDGPAGPRRQLRTGVLHVAAQTGLAIVPLRLSGGPAVRLPMWDRKWIPLPGARVTVEVGAPLTVRPGAIDAARALLLAELG